MLRKLSMMLIVGMFVVFVGCKGDQGDVGPAGPKGDTGAAGTNGTNGTNGTDGVDGSIPLLLSSGATKTDSTGGFTTGLQNLNADAIATLEKTAVLVYVKVQGVYWPLPGIVSFGGGVLSQFTFVHGIQDDVFFVSIIPTNWSEDVDDAPERDFEDVRVVLLPGEEITDGRKNLDVDFKKYEDVVAKFGLSESKVIQLKNISLKKK